MFDQSDKKFGIIFMTSQTRHGGAKVMYEEIKKVVEAPASERKPRLIICATNKYLEQNVGKGNFLAELFFAHSDNVINVPSLTSSRMNCRCLQKSF